MIKPTLKPCKGIGKANGVKGCGEKFLHRTFGLCSSCLSDFLFSTDAGKLVMQSRVIPRAKNKIQKEQKAKDRKTRDKLKKLSELEAEAKKSFQKWVRLRDADKNCPSCGTNVSVPCWDGGHFKKAELYSGSIFDERNCHKQCRKCNYFLGGNELNYREGLVQRYGLDFVLNLESDANRFKEFRYTREQYRALKAKYDDKIKNKDFSCDFLPFEMPETMTIKVQKTG